MSKGLGFQVSYTLRLIISVIMPTIITAGSTPQNAYDYEHEYSQSPFDQRQRLVVSGQWKLPIGKDGLVLNNDSTAAKLIGGWQYNIIASFRGRKSVQRHRRRQQARLAETMPPMQIASREHLQIRRTTATRSQALREVADISIQQLSLSQQRVYSALAALVPSPVRDVETLT